MFLQGGASNLNLEVTHSEPARRPAFLCPKRHPHLARGLPLDPGGGGPTNPGAVAPSGLRRVPWINGRWVESAGLERWVKPSPD